MSTEYVHPQAEHDGKLVVDKATGHLRIDPDGRLLVHKVQNEEEKLCQCPRCENIFSVICVEGGSECFPMDPEEDGFCRRTRGDTLSIISPALQFNKPQLYTPDEVKLYYPNWETIAGWNESDDLWLAFQAGPPTGKAQSPIDYHINIKTPDFHEDNKTVPLLMSDILNCPDYLIEYEANGGRCYYQGVEQARVLWHPATTCTGNCQCSFTQAQYKQWKKNNHRESPYYYIRAIQSSACSAPHKPGPPGSLNSGWCFAPAELRPKGLFTACQTWYSSSRCSGGPSEREELYRCCDVPPTLVGWYTCTCNKPYRCSTADFASFPPSTTRPKSAAPAITRTSGVLTRTGWAISPSSPASAVKENACCLSRGEA